MSDLGEAQQDGRRLFGLALWKWTAISHLMSLLGLLTLIFGVFQYVGTVRAERAGRTLEMIEDWVDGGYRDAFLGLAARTEPLVAKARANLGDPSAASEADLREARSQIVAVVLDGAEGDAQFDKVVYYFNRLGLCLEARLCLDDTARIFFADTLDDFLSVFGDEIAARRQARPGYAAGVDLLRGWVL